ncbi:extracellular solute-binding protein, partial [Paenibacillus sepulcri]|nr:extracellular solute-binding protein [Paenibacillus sepulcri]
MKRLTLSLLVGLMVVSTGLLSLVGNAGADFAGRFLQGSAAMMWNGDWAVQMLNDAIQQKGVKLNYDVAPLPHWKDSEPATTGSF